MPEVSYPRNKKDVYAWYYCNQVCPRANSTSPKRNRAVISAIRISSFVGGICPTRSRMSSPSGAVIRKRHIVPKPSGATMIIHPSA